jgi:hypothetical protein
MQKLTPQQTAVANAVARDIVINALLAHAIHSAPDPDDMAKRLLSFCLNSVDLTRSGMQAEPNAEAICEHMKAVIRDRVTGVRHHPRTGTWQD